MKKIICTVIAVCMLFSLGACSTGENISDEFKSIEEKAIAEVESMKEVTEEDMHKAINYIKENVETALDDSGVKENVLRCAACLKYWTKGVEHEVKDYAEKAYDYSKELFKEGEKKTEAVINTAKNELKELGDKISAEQDKLVSECHNLIKK